MEAKLGQDNSQAKQILSNSTVKNSDSTVSYSSNIEEFS